MCPQTHRHRSPKERREGEERLLSFLPRHRCSRGNRIDVTLLSELSGSCQIRRASHFPSGWLQERRDATASPRGLDLNKAFSDLQFLHPILWCSCFAQLVLKKTNEQTNKKHKTVELQTTVRSALCLRCPVKMLRFVV